MDVLSRDLGAVMWQRWGTASAFPPKWDSLQVFCHLFRWQPCALFLFPNSHDLGIPWAPHGHTRAHPWYRAHASWFDLAETMARADLHRNTGNNHILLICTDPVMPPALFLGFGSKYIAALTTSTFFTKDSVIKSSRLQHTINQSSLPVWICNSAVWKHLGTISAQILLDKGQIYFLLNQMLFDWLWFIDKSDRVPGCLQIVGTCDPEVFKKLVSENNSFSLLAVPLLVQACKT